MNPEVVVRDSVEAAVEGPDSVVLLLGLLVPLSGPLGLIGPSALDAARLACSEINTAGGVMGRPIELVVSDVGGSPAEAGREARALADGGLVDAFVGLHTSGVHRAIEASLGGRMPYIFTPPHEGGTRLPGVVLLGDSPFRQLAPALDWLTRRRRLRRWALVGSDYIWTWSVHGAAAPLVRSVEGEVVLERLVPFGLDPGRGSEELIDALVKARVDAVLLSLIGRDLAMFNRAFSRANLGPRIVRVSGSLEENGLLAAGGDESGELYASMRSFAGQQETRRIALAENHQRLFGEHAPVLDAYSEGCYDGVHLAAALASAGGLSTSQSQRLSAHLLSPVDSETARKAWAAAPLGRPPGGTYIARADGLDLSVIARL
jgi:ABC-type branched-subunit amino acid transport system substrate-binding protein